MNVPLSFEPNRGQSNPGVQFLSRGPGYSLFLASDEVVLNLQKQRPAATRKSVAVPVDRLLMALIGANRGAKAVGADPQPGVVSYFIGNDPNKWHSGIPTFGKVCYSGIYPGVDLVFYGKQRHLEYDFVVAPGADPSRIAWQIDGARASIDREGNLVLNAANGPAGFKKPVVYQMSGETRSVVNGSFTVSGSRIGFRIGAYDHSKPLIIDPVLTYATYLGGSGTDNIGNWNGPGILGNNPSQGLAIDSKGSVYVTGYTTSSDFPTTSGAYQRINKSKGAPSVFVSKFSADGKSLEYSTYIGGSGWDQAFAIAVDSQGSAYVTGQTSSDDFPITSGAYQSLCWPEPVNPPNIQTPDCGSDQSTAFVTKLNSAGTELLYSTFLGGYGGAYGAAIAVDDSGRAYVVGVEGVVCNPKDYAIPSCFPTTTNAVIDGTQTGGGSPFYSFVSVFDPTGSQLLYSTLFGDLNGLASGPGSGGDALASGVTVDANGNFYLVGYTKAGKLPTTQGVIQPTSGPPQVSTNALYAFRGMVAEFYPVAPDGGSSLEYATYLGGKTKVSSQDFISGITTDAQGNVYVVGNTNGGDFPVTKGAYQTSCGAGGGCAGAFVAKLDPFGTQILWSTYVGGFKQDGSDGVHATGPIALDGNDNVYIAASMQDGFPMVNPVEPVPNGGDPQVLIAELDHTGSKLLFSTDIGAQGLDSVSPAGLAVDSDGNIYLAGNVNGPDLITTPGAFQTKSSDGSCCGQGNGFVARIAAHGTATAKLNIFPSQTVYGEQTTLTATVSAPSKYASMPTGYVELDLGTKALVRLNLDSTGTAAYKTASIPPGTYQLTAKYGGDRTYGSGSATANLTVKMIHAATPVFEPGSAIFTSVRHVKITDATKGAAIYYKTTGAKQWTPYTAPIAINSTMTITAYATAKYCMNSATASATYTTRFPGLVETAVTNPPASVSIGGSFPVTDTVENIGKSAAAGSVTRYYFSTQKTLTAKSYLLIGHRSVPALAVGASSTPRTGVTVTVPSGVAHAAYYLLACADDTNTVAEAYPGRRCKAANARTTVK
ncbi:MAG TPA: SBBP repeat-containing protein [Terracidiphilus sp.]|nr:SBBP repeat-containing protein [Terracidiphilus sp.]